MLQTTMHAAIIHSDIEEGAWVSLDFSEMLLTNGKRASTELSTFRRRFAIANTTGTNIQHSNSDGSSDCFVSE